MTNKTRETDVFCLQLESCFVVFGGSMNAFKHLKTILIHKKWVFYFARKLGIGWQGFWHDMSKFSPVEFFESIKYYTGTRSPIDVCKEINGYSGAWLHHKGRNPHHYEYWQDNFDKGGQPLRMPVKYLKELICDYLAAGRAYKGAEFDFKSEWEWWQGKNRNKLAMHKDTWEVVDYVLSMLYIKFDRKHLEDLTKSDWILFRQIVESALQNCISYCK